ncbi:sensor domain-containing diguanylate cyclase [Nevskia sp.]|uniref:GGDEF domain-containing protein n=1 Tax=Nevskia sp. TaxID=1929292 RepID=UPI0025DC0D27|nr:sensor domain-containing diguanylate cyclase [Nevskia sp.]
MTAIDSTDDAAATRLQIATLEAEVERLRLALSAADVQIAESDVIRRDSLLLRAFMDRSDTIAWLKDDRGRLVWANRHWFERFGLHEIDTLDKTDFELFGEADASRVRALDLEILGGHEPQRSIEIVQDALGEARSWQVTRFPFHDSLGNRYIGSIAHDDTERVRAHEDIRRQSITDSLTGLLNRRGFDTLAGPELSRARRRGASCVLAFVDLDGLKGVNDRLGHASGDAIIVLAGMLLRKAFRTTDIVARIGGDEFAVFAPDTGGEVDAIRRRLKSAVAELSANPILEAQLGFSIGLRPCPPEGRETLDALIAEADGLMYLEKQGKRG